MGQAKTTLKTRFEQTDIWITAHRIDNLTQLRSNFFS